MPNPANATTDRPAFCAVVPVDRVPPLPTVAEPVTPTSNGSTKSKLAISATYQHWSPESVIVHVHDVSPAPISLLWNTNTFDVPSALNPVGVVETALPEYINTTTVLPAVVPLGSVGTMVVLAVFVPLFS